MSEANQKHSAKEQKMLVRNYFSERLPVTVEFDPEKEGRTQPEFKESCDVNYILKKYNQTGVLKVNAKTPKFGDFSQSVDYQDAMNLVVKANEMFDQLPADVRKRFNNDPQQFLEFANDEANHDEMVRLGMAVKDEVETQEVPVESPTESQTE